MMPTPLVTMIVLAFNQQEYISAAIQSALNQDYDNLEIILSDDGSNDQTYEVMCGIASQYQGKHKLIVNRNQKNEGLIAHVNQLLNWASGDLIVYACGDDLSAENRISTLVRLYQNAKSDRVLIHSAVTRINERSQVLGYFEPNIKQDSELILKEPGKLEPHIGATAAISKSLVQQFGDIQEKAAIEDTVYVFRAALAGEIMYSPEPLIQYRFGEGLTTKKKPPAWKPLKRYLNDLAFHRSQLAILNQRLLDLHSTDHPDANSIREKLEKHIARKHLTLLFKQFQFISLFGFARKNPAIFSEAIQSYWNKKRIIRTLCVIGTLLTVAYCGFHPT
jgi:glycosyltransferase involved in cell wall biosynthesis